MRDRPSTSGNRPSGVRDGGIGGRRGRRALLGAALAGSATVLTALLLLLGPAFGADVAPNVPPPQLYAEFPSRVPAGAPFALFVSSNVPVVYTVRYGDDEHEATDQDLHHTLTALAGPMPLEVVAIDAGGRSAEASTTVLGLRVPEPVLEATDSATVGDAIAVRFTWGDRDGDHRAIVADAWIELDGRPLEAHPVDGGLLALAALPLTSAAGSRLVRGVVVDEFGTYHEARSSLDVAPNPHPVQQLSIPQSVLAVSTTDSRELEARTLEAAFAAVGPAMRWERPFLLPITGRGTSGFGLPRRYGPGGNVSYHLGTDIAAPTGTPILATNDGVVLVAGQYPIKGGLVILDHGFGVTSLYFHQSAIAVEVGDVVERGDTIGYVGSTGLSTGPHLHWEMRVDGVPTDPMAWVDQVVPNAPWARP